MYKEYNTNKHRCGPIKALIVRIFGRYIGPCQNARAYQFRGNLYIL